MFLFFFLQLHPRHMEVPRLEVELEPQVLAYTTATTTATPDLSRICGLHHGSRLDLSRVCDLCRSLQQRQIP